jgi:hypothetical protein
MERLLERSVAKCEDLGRRTLDLCTYDDRRHGQRPSATRAA